MEFDFIIILVAMVWLLQLTLKNVLQNYRPDSYETSSEDPVCYGEHMIQNKIMISLLSRLPWQRKEKNDTERNLD